MSPQQQLTKIGIAHHRYGDKPFGILQPDRLLHMYVIGQTGTGKSTLLANMARQDADAGRGFCLVEPHGDLARDLSANLGRPHRYWDVADPNSTLGYNPLLSVSPGLQPLVASGLIDTLKRQWSDAWGARMEHLLRYALLALLSHPDTDLRDVMRLFVEKSFRSQVISTISDPQVLHFWTKEFPNMNYKTAIDGVAPIANKIGAFLAHPVVRKAVCEPAEPLRLRKLMDDGEILIVNLAKGRIGADTANVVGGLIVSSLMHAAFSRHDLEPAKRQPYFLFVDEFHAFSTSALAGMLSETRKYSLGLILAHQYLHQTPTDVFEAIMGNVGSMVVFRVGASDAPLLSRQLDDASPRNLMGQPNYRAHVRLMVEGRKSGVFTTRTSPPTEP